MSISSSLRRAAKIHEKIEALRKQLALLLDRARSEIVAVSNEEVSTALRRSSRPKMLKRSGRRAYQSVSLQGTNGRSKETVKTKQKAGVQRPIKRRKRSPLLGVKRAASPSGPLAPAVVKVLRTANKPMNVRDILDRLYSSGYEFTASEPKKNLAARVYRLRGVKQVSAGLFTAI